MTRKSAATIASDLREIRQDKILTVDANGKRMGADRLERFRRHIDTLDQAIEGFDNLAKAQAERQAQQQEEVAS
ncbi:hypothetical protein [Neorhizobium sp. P12A]|uniref:hypothetical protein n=1 Tax=Neorhizobium sp. P12A TaxID=2268027 RepID=UPI0011EE42DD|nr:hypothetical protein [Neorhizobium sp. P12A]